MVLLDGFYRDIALMQRQICQSEQRYHFLRYGYIHLKDCVPSMFQKNTKAYQNEIYEALTPCMTYLYTKELSQDPKGMREIQNTTEESSSSDCYVWLVQCDECKVLLWPRFTFPSNKYFSNLHTWFKKKFTQIYPPTPIETSKGSLLIFTRRSPVMIKSRSYGPIIEYAFRKTKQEIGKTSPLSFSSKIETPTT